MVENELLVQHSISFIVRQNEVLEFRIHIDQRHSGLFYNYWSEYSLQEILADLGFPDTGYIDIGDFETYPGFSITLIYEDQDIYYTVYGQKQDGLVCPTFDQDIIGFIQIGIIDSGYEEGLAWIPSTYDRLFQDIFGISDQNFYEQILLDPNICLEPHFVDP